MEQEKYETRKARSLDMLKSGVEPIKNGFNEYFIPSQADKNKKYKIIINHGCIPVNVQTMQRIRICANISCCLKLILP